MIFIYLLCVNFIGFCMMWHDKRQAIRRKQRVPEKRLWLVAIIGGAVGMWLSMYVFRHKTKHAQFVIGFLLLSLVQIAGVYYLWSERIVSIF